MNLYQAAYTRRGKQGEGAGWRLVASSEDMSQVAKEGFGGLAGSLAELANRSVPGNAVGVFAYDRFLYYMHINYETAATGITDARGVSFTHGYCFNLTDYYALCRDAAQFLGVNEKTFLTEDDASVRSFPVVREIPHSSMNFDFLIKKYGFSSEDYRRLLIGATCALEELQDPLCIRTDAPLAAYGEICREVVYLILCGLPFHLRVKLTFFSYKSGRTKVFFSDQTEGNNYFDLATGKYRCDKRGLEQYRFTQLYSMPNDIRQKVLRTVADFIDETFDVPLRDMNCEIVEHGFQARLKNDLRKVIDKDAAVALLASFMRLPRKRCRAADAYLAQLLEAIEGFILSERNAELAKQTGEYVRHSADMALRKAYRMFYVGQILGAEKKTGYRLLWEQYQSDRREHNALLATLLERDAAYARAYYEEMLLPSRLQTLNDVMEYFKECGENCAVGNVHKALLWEITEKEMRSAAGAAGLTQTREKAERTAELLDRHKSVYGESYRRYADMLFWDVFDPAWFSPADEKAYRRWGLEAFAADGAGGAAGETARAVKKRMDEAAAAALERETAAAIQEADCRIREETPRGAFAFSVHKIAIGYFAALAVSFFLFCLQKYLGVRTVILGIVQVAAAAAVLSGWILGVLTDGGPKAYLQKRGIDSVLKLVSLIAGMTVTVLITAAVYQVIRSVSALQDMRDRGSKTALCAALFGFFGVMAIVSAILYEQSRDEMS